MHCEFEAVINALASQMSDRDARRCREEAARMPRFVFDSDPPIEAREWGQQLLEADAFPLPDPSGTYFEYPLIFKDTGETGRGAHIAMEHDGQAFTMHSATNLGRGFGWSPDIPFFARFIGGDEWRVRSMSDPACDLSRDLYALNVSENLSLLVRCGAALTFRGIERRDVAPSRQARRAAERRGEPVPRGYTFLVLGERGKRENQGGTHASPIPHFRRGHVRRIDDGRLVKVRPTWVMAEAATPPMRKVITNQETLGGSHAG